MHHRTVNIVCFGGGTGLPSLLSGLVENPWFDITAVVGMFDNGGSSGDLRDRFGILPPGDILKCLLAQSKYRQAAREMLLKRLQHETHPGHTGGNALLMGLQTVYGNYPDAVDALGQLLSIRGKVVPVTLSQSTLCARYANGITNRGETSVDEGVFQGWRVEDLFLDPVVAASDGALLAIDKADVFVVGPGSFYTSVLPNFLPTGVRERIIASHAPIIFNCNLLTEGVRDETVGSTVAVLERMVGRKLAFVTKNVARPDEEVLQKYARERKYPLVRSDEDTSDPRIVCADLWLDGSIARHDSARLSHLVSALIERLRV